MRALFSFRLGQSQLQFDDRGTKLRKRLRCDFPRVEIETYKHVGYRIDRLDNEKADSWVLH
jgi:hypothetical protein